MTYGFNEIDGFNLITLTDKRTVVETSACLLHIFWNCALKNYRIARANG
jgi:hypothetical protein